MTRIHPPTALLPESQISDSPDSETVKPKSKAQTSSPHVPLASSWYVPPPPSPQGPKRVLVPVDLIHFFAVDSKAG